MNARDEHISGADLEALAAGQPPSSQNAPGHLAECTRCHDALSAMRAENRLFASEFAQESSEMDYAIGSRKEVPVLQAYKPFIMYMVAASIMLACALALIWSGKRPTDEAAEALIDPKAKETPAEKKIAEKPELVKDDAKPPKADENPKPGEEVVYEGKTAKEWAAQLKSGGGDPKAAHALTEIGRDALPCVLELLRDPVIANAALGARAQNQELVRGILKTMRLEKGDLTQFMSMLKDENFQVRRGAVDLLGLLASQQEDLSADVQTALTQALKDRDKAVVEAARNELERIKKVKSDTDAKLESMARQELTRVKELAKVAALYPVAKATLQSRFMNANASYAGTKAADEARTVLAQLERDHDILASNEKVNADRIARLQALENEVLEASKEYQAALKKDPFVQRDADLAKEKLEKVKAELNSVRKPAKTSVGEGNPDF